MPKKIDKEMIQQAYIQVCKDSDFNLHWEDAALFTSDIFRIEPMEVAYAFPNIQDLNTIALGLHPLAPNPKIKLYEK
jgi:hypothetical protein